MVRLLVVKLVNCAQFTVVWSVMLSISKEALAVWVAVLISLPNCRVSCSVMSISAKCDSLAVTT